MDPVFSQMSLELKLVDNNYTAGQLAKRWDAERGIMDLRNMDLVMAPLVSLRELQPKVLDLRDNPICSLSEVLGEISSLKELYLGSTTPKMLGSEKSLGIPESIGELKNLEKLGLTHLKIQTLPNSMGTLLSLQVLDLENTQLEALPLTIGDCTNLQHLNLASNCLHFLPPSLHKLKYLEFLDIFGNHIRKLPEAITQMSALERINCDWEEIKLPSNWRPESLDLSSQFLQTLPNSITNLDSLVSLDLSNNFLQELPGEIGKLKKLENLRLGNNFLSSLPNSLKQLTNLRTIDLKVNMLKSIPEFLQEMKLERLDLAINEIKDYPAMISNLSIGPAYHTFTDETRFLFKMVLLGEQGVGKTLLRGQFIDERLDELTFTGMASAFSIMDTELAQYQVALQIWDIAPFGHVSRRESFFRGSLGYWLVFDISNYSSFQTLDCWISDIQRFSLRPVRVVLIGNKCDLENKRVVSKQEAMRYARKLSTLFGHVPYIETSAHTDERVDQAFRLLAQLIFDMTLEENQKERAIYLASDHAQSSARQVD